MKHGLEFGGKRWGDFCSVGQRRARVLLGDVGPSLGAENQAPQAAGVSRKSTPLRTRCGEDEFCRIGERACRAGGSWGRCGTAWAAPFQRCSIPASAERRGTNRSAACRDKHAVPDRYSHLRPRTQPVQMMASCSSTSRARRCLRASYGGCRRYNETNNPGSLAAGTGAHFTRLGALVSVATGMARISAVPGRPNLINFPPEVVLILTQPSDECRGAGTCSNAVTRRSSAKSSSAWTTKSSARTRRRLRSTDADSRAADSPPRHG